MKVKRDNEEVHIYTAILFGKEGFWEDEENQTGPPPDGHRIRCDNEPNFSVSDESSGTESRKDESNGDSGESSSLSDSSNVKSDDVFSRGSNGTYRPLWGSSPDHSFTS